MSKPSPYHCESQQRILRVLLSMFGHEVAGLSTTDVSKMHGTSLPLAMRDIYNLVESGCAERLPGSDKVRISPRLGSKALITMAALQAAEKEITELQTRFSVPQ
jgi:DNA-binding IclR family transcriptional regulator